MPLNSTDSVDVQMKKLSDKTNELTQLRSSLMSAIKKHYEAEFEVRKIKEEMKSLKSEISSIKEIIKAEKL